MPRLLYTLEDRFEATAEAQHWPLASRLLLALSVVCAIAGDLTNPERGFRALFTSEH